MAAGTEVSAAIGAVRAVRGSRIVSVHVGLMRTSRAQRTRHMVLRVSGIMRLMPRVPRIMSEIPGIESGVMSRIPRIKSGIKPGVESRVPRIMSRVSGIMPRIVRVARVVRMVRMLWMRGVGGTSGVLPIVVRRH